MTDQTDLAVTELSVDEIIAELDAEYTGDIPKRAIHAARRRRDEVIPRLIECIEKATAEVRAGGQLAGEGHFFGIMLLSEFDAVEALPAILDALSLPGNGPFDLFGDIITSTLPGILSALAGNAREKVDELIANSSLNEFVRWSAVESYLHFVRDGRLTRTEAIDKLHKHLQRVINDGDQAITPPLVTVLENLAAESALDDIRLVFERDLIDPTYTRISDVEERIAAGEATVQEALTRCNPTGIGDTIEELHEWAAYAPYEVARRRAEEMNLRKLQYLDDVHFNERALRSDLPPTRKAKPGPNEPCPCGSGKKFKRCCGRE